MQVLRRRLVCLGRMAPFCLTDRSSGCQNAGMGYHRKELDESMIQRFWKVCHRHPRGETKRALANHRLVPSCGANRVLHAERAIQDFHRVPLSPPFWPIPGVSPDRLRCRLPHRRLGCGRHRRSLSAMLSPDGVLGPLRDGRPMHRSEVIHGRRPGVLRRDQPCHHGVAYSHVDPAPTVVAGQAWLGRCLRSRHFVCFPPLPTPQRT